MALRRWWTQKYKLPSNHKLFQETTLVDLLIEYYEDEFHENKLEAYRDESGEYFLGDTDDELFNKWEKELQMGIDPDLTEGMSDEAKEKLKKEQEKYKKGKQLKKEIEEDNISFEGALGSSKYNNLQFTGAYTGKNIVKTRNLDSKKWKILGEE